MPSPSQATITYIYPKSSPSSSFDLDYYLNTHWPLVEKTWGSQGLINWTVTAGDKDSDFHVVTVVLFESLESFEKLTGVETVVGDVKNFTDETPKSYVGNVVGRGGV